MNEQERKKQIEDVLAKRVAPILARHGGNLYLTEIRNNTAYVKFSGHCSGCPSAKYTMETVVKEKLLEYTDLVDDVKLVEDVNEELYDFAKALLEHKVKY